MQSETGFPSSHQLKSYVAYKSRLKLAARAVLSADAGLLVSTLFRGAYTRNVHVLTGCRVLVLSRECKFLDLVQLMDDDVVSLR